MTFKFADPPTARPPEEPSGLRARPDVEAPPASSNAPAAKRRALLVGAPNVGKSVIFGALTGRYVTVSNYPGTTVEITRGRVTRDGQATAPSKSASEPEDHDAWELLDSPGTNNLVAMSEDEAVTRDILLTERHDALVQVGDAKNLSRTLLMTLQLAELGVPFLLDLNMMDEARTRGLAIDFAALALELPGIEVNGSAATRGEGIEPVRAYLAKSATAVDIAANEQMGKTHEARVALPCAPKFPADIEAAIARLEAALPDLPVAKRAVATILLAGDRGLGGAIDTIVSPEIRALAAIEGETLKKAHALPVFALLSKLRLGRAQAIVRAVQTKVVAAAGAPGTTSAGVPWPHAIAVAAAGSAVAAFAYAASTAATIPAFVLFALSMPIAALLVHRHAQARVAMWKLAFAFAGGYLASWLVGWFTHSTIPDHVGALVGLAGLAALAYAGDRKDADASRTFGRLATHQVWGVPILVVVLFFAYKVVGEFGAGTAVDFLENGVFGSSIAQADVGSAAAPTTDIGTLSTDTAAEGAERLLYVRAGTPGAVRGPANLGDVSVLAQIKHGATYETDPTARIDFYPPSGKTPPQARIWTGFLNRAAYAMFSWIGITMLTLFFVGPYGMLTMGVTYAVAIVLPVVATFFFVFSMLEDSGYLPRLAVMANRQLRLIGLNGKAVLPMVLGLGCDTMATLTARILETKKERVLVTLILALGIPCSSQLSVVFALMQRTSGAASIAWIASVLLTIGIVGWVAAKIVPGDQSDFLMEMPPIRRPMIGNLATKTFARIEWYLKEAVPLFLIGTALLFVLDLFDLLVYVHRAGEPIVHGVLGFTRDRAVSDKVSEALLIGFLRRDFGAAGLLDLARGGQLSTADIAVSMVTITLFIPCIANVFMIVKERGWKVGAAMCGFIFPYAVLVGWIVRGVFSVLHIGAHA